MRRFLKSFQYAWNGIMQAWAGQPNFKFHIVIAFVVVAAGFYFKISEVEWLMVVLAIGFVIAVELINTSIEYLVDLVSPQHQPLAGKVKDIAAGAVLVAAITSFVVGIIIFSKYLFA